MKTCVILLSCSLAAIPSTLPAAQSIARVWDEEILSAIRIDLPHPPVHARNLFNFSVAMYDAWAAYDSVAVGYVYHDKHPAPDIEAARKEAVSYAAYRLLKERYALSKSAVKTLAALDARMVALGYDKDNLSQDVSTPAGVGNKVAAAVSSYFLQDGALQTRAYADYPPDQGGYASVNRPLITGSETSLVFDVNRWQPLVITNQVSQNGIPLEAIQKFLGAQWLGVRPFALTRLDSAKPWIDPGPPDKLDGAGDADYRSQVVDVIRASDLMTPDDGVITDISPGAFGNNSLGTNDGQGRSINPATGQPYAPNPVKRGDFTRVLAEFWADGPTSETPPGHWNTIANYVSDVPGFEKRIGGTGEIVKDLEWDVKVYFAMNAALHDAACAAWSLKRYYDGWRPIEAIRYMGMLGQSTDLNSLYYHPRGLTLVPGLIEEVTEATVATGQRHFGLPVGEIAIHAWPGQPADPSTQHSGTRWMLAVDWLPYQKKTFVTPAFPGYISGHSTFSRSAAEVLAAFTGTPFFPGGMATYKMKAGAFLTFEKGPEADVELQWATYYDAADQAGISRIFGGIHVSKDDFFGRKAGSQCGKGAWKLARQYFDGSILAVPFAMTLRPVNAFDCEISFETVRGFHYKLQSAAEADDEFLDVPFSEFQATDVLRTQMDNIIGVKRFFRAVRVE
ncbi:MAG: vanadium-dependent haloperoxidase [Verrucomicrobia bacterium]|nr:vanadium-dependent haloperoxidase [Verrucomicrobiota bacterium]